MEDDAKVLTGQTATYAELAHPRRARFARITTSADMRAGLKTACRVS